MFNQKKYIFDLRVFNKNNVFYLDTILIDVIRCSHV